MTQKITRDFLKELKSNISMIDYMTEEYGSDFIVSQNDWYMTNCPMPEHNDSSPSFGVNNSKQTFNCFGCGSQGDIIKLVQAAEKLTFVECIQKLSLFSGVDVETTNLDVKYIIREMNSSIDKYLSDEHGSNFPGGLTESEFLVTFARRTKKIENQLNHSKQITDWIDNLYLQLDSYIDEKNYKKVNDVWKSFANNSKQFIESIQNA